MPHDRLFRALANLALWGDLDELSLGALRKYVGEESVRAALTDDDEESIMRGHFAEVFLRLANGHALPKNLGMCGDLRIIHEELGIDPANTNYEEYDG